MAMEKLCQKHEAMSHYACLWYQGNCINEIITHSKLKFYFYWKARKIIVYKVRKVAQKNDPIKSETHSEELKFWLEDKIFKFRANRQNIRILI